MVLRFFRRKENREFVGFFAAGIATLAGAGWAVFIYIKPSSDEKKPVSQLTGNCAVVAGGSVSAQNINLTCGPSDEDIKRVVSSTLASNELVNLIQDARNNTINDYSRVDKLARALGLMPKDIEAILISVDKKNLTSDRVYGAFSANTHDYIEVKDAIDRISSPANAPDINRITSALQAGDLETAQALLSILESQQIKPKAITAEKENSNECDGSNDIVIIHNATLEENQIGTSTNYFNGPWPAINLIGQDYRNRSKPLPILMDTRYRVFYKAAFDEHFFSFVAPAGAKRPEFQLRTTTDIFSHLLITDAATGSVVVQGRIWSFAAVDLDTRAGKYIIDLRPEPSSEPGNYCFAISTREVGWGGQEFTPDLKP